MKQCPKCKTSLQDDYRYCDCGYEFNGPATPMASTVSYTSTYHTARTIAQVVSFVGWSTAIVSAIAFIATLLLSGQIRGGALLFSLLPSLGGIVIGIFIIGTGQLMRVGVDTADHTGEILALMRAERLSRNEKHSVVEGSSP